ncbi:MAG: hypothetical protein KC910_33330 [Candidatus Eremiobacteraeota bacterium]|nr:hypothetical protein [Candidatus Eremiobacteraeota bacterium]
MLITSLTGLPPRPVVRPATRPTITAPQDRLDLGAAQRERDMAVTLKAYRILNGNRVKVTDPTGLEHTFTTPSRCDGAQDSRLDYGGKQWLWDSAAHVMNLAWTEPQVAQSELRAVFANQNSDPDSKDFGFVPHMNYFNGDGSKVPAWAQPHYQRFLDSADGRRLVPDDKRAEFCQGYWSSPVHSDITQPPILAMAALELQAATGDKAFLNEMLPKLSAYYDYLHDRRADADGLVRIIHPWESGWDNSQRWDESIGLGRPEAPIERSQIDVRKMGLFCKYKALDWDLDKILESGDFAVKPVDYNALYAKNLECLAKLYQAADQPQRAEHYQQRADQVKTAIFDKMWDGDKYCDLMGERQSPVKSAAMFYPMMLEGEPHGTDLIANHLLNPSEFNPPDGYSVPTTSLDDPSVPKQLLGNPNDHYWRGNIWVIVNFFTRCGLQQHLKSNPDNVLARAMSDKIRNSTFEALDRADFYEYFHPLAEPGQNHQGFGVPSFGWNGLATFMNKKPAFL